MFAFSREGRGDVGRSCRGGTMMVGSRGVLRFIIVGVKGIVIGLGRWMSVKRLVLRRC